MAWGHYGAPMTDVTKPAANARTTWSRKRLVIALVVVAALAAAATAFWPRSETFDSPTALLARLEQLGAPCPGFTASADGAWTGWCKRGGDMVEISTEAPDGWLDKHVTALLTDDVGTSAVATGDGWCVFGEPGYVRQVAELLGGEFHDR